MGSGVPRPVRTVSLSLHELCKGRKLHFNPLKRERGEGDDFSAEQFLLSLFPSRVALSLGHWSV